MEKAWLLFIAWLPTCLFALKHQHVEQLQGYRRIDTQHVTQVGVTSDLGFCIRQKTLLSRSPVPKRGERPEGQPWPGKGGNTGRTGHVLDRACPTNLSLPSWSFYTYDVMYATPAVDAEGSVYVVTETSEVMKLDRNGDLLWSYRLMSPAASNPVLAGGSLFVCDGDGVAYALDLQGAGAKWSRRIGQMGSPGNYAVTVAGDLAIFHADVGIGSITNASELVAVDTATGHPRWRSAVHGPVFNIMPAVADEGSSLVFTDMDGGVHKLDAATGAEIWLNAGFPFPLTREEGWLATPPDSAPRGHSAMAVIGDGVVFTAGNPTRKTGRVRALKLATGEEVWNHEVNSMMGNGAALADIDGVSTLVFGTGITALHPIEESKAPFVGTLYALDASSGKELWRFQSEPMFSFMCPGSVVHPSCLRGNLPDSWSAPLIDKKGTVYVGWQGGVLYALDGRNGNLLGLFNTTEGIQSQPSAGPSGELIVASGMHVHSFWEL